jgi:hypothetical protein
VSLDFDPDTWCEVQSSNLSGVGTKDGFLVVQFRNGDVYRYPELSHLLSSLVCAPSVGKYFHEFVRPEPSERLVKGRWPDEEEN